MKLVPLKIQIKILTNFKVTCETHGVVLRDNRSSLSRKIKVEWILCGHFWGERWRLCPEFHVITVILTVFLRLPSKKGRRLSPPQNIRPYGLFGLTALVAVLNTVFTLIQHCSCTMNKSAPLALTVITTQTFCLLLHFLNNRSSLFAIKGRFSSPHLLNYLCL